MRTPIADKMIREASRKPVALVVEKEAEANPFAGSGAGKNQRAAMLQWMELKTKESELRAQAEQLKGDAEAIAEEVGIVEIIERLEDQTAYFDEIQRKMKVRTQSYPRYAQLWNKLTEKMQEQMADVAKLMDEMMEAEKTATAKKFPTHAKFSKKDIKARGVGESVGDTLKGWFQKAKSFISGLFKRADSIDADLKKLDQMVSGQTERRRPRRRIKEALASEDPNNADEALGEFLSSSEYDSLPRGRDALAPNEFDAVFEHGQLWIVHNPSGAQWSVVDTNYGFSFEMVSEGDLFERRRPRRRRIKEDAFGPIPDAGADPMNVSNDNEITMNFTFNEAWLANGYYEAVRNTLAGLVVSWPQISGLPGEREWTVRVSGIVDERRQKVLKSMAGEYEGSYESEGLPWGM